MKQILLMDREMSKVLKSYGNNCCRNQCDTQKILKDILAYSIKMQEKAEECLRDIPQVVINIAVTSAGQKDEPVYITDSTMEETCNIKVKITVA